MIRKGLLTRELKRKLLFYKFFNLRNNLLKLKKKINSKKDYFNLLNKFSKLPRNSMRIRLRNRCILSGRPRGYYSFFGLSRHVLREFSFKKFVPGLLKSSW